MQSRELSEDTYFTYKSFQGGVIWPNTNIDSVAELRKKLILMLSPSLKRQTGRDASSAEEAQLVKYGGPLCQDTKTD